MWRKLFLHCLVWGALFALPWTAAADSVPQKPEAFLPASVFEFAPVVEGTEVVHAFVIHNRGDAVLEILSVSSG
jgi:hypothetical protein